MTFSKLKNIGFQFYPTCNGQQRWRKEIYCTNSIWVYRNKVIKYSPFVGLDKQVFDILEGYDFGDRISVCLCYDSNGDIKYTTRYSDISKFGYKNGCYQHIQVDKDEWEIVKREFSEIKKILCVN